MAFCKNCGKSLAADERFCVQCGSDAAATATGAAAARLIQPQQGVPGVYGVPGQIPVVVMPPAPAKRGGKMSTIIAVLLAVWFAGYYLMHRVPPITPAQEAAAEAALTKQQSFDCNFRNADGYLQVTNGKWTNHSSVAIQAATLECDQTDSNGTDLDEMRINLKSPQGPLQAGGSQDYNAFQMGEIANNATKVHCTVVTVTPPDNTQQ
jgi:zinc-ribbon domain